MGLVRATPLYLRMNCFSQGRGSVMAVKRTYHRFAHKGANFRICCERLDVATGEIVRQRAILEAYIRRHAEFATSLTPIEPKAGAPEVACRMARAAAAVGVGPMAAVAGAMAQMAAEAVAEFGEAIVENGGDMYLICRRPVVVGLFAGDSPLRDRLAFAVDPERTPVAICSSSGRMGHSLSLGACDLATVVATDACLADAAATDAANRVRTVDDIDPTLERIAAIDGVSGVLLIQDDRIGLAGALPELVANCDAELDLKVTRDPAG